VRASRRAVSSVLILATVMYRSAFVNAAWRLVSVDVIGRLLTGLAVLAESTLLLLV
jgi:hypothetical protein